MRNTNGSHHQAPVVRPARARSTHKCLTLRARFLPIANRPAPSHMLFLLLHSSLTSLCSLLHSTLQATCTRALAWPRTVHLEAGWSAESRSAHAVSRLRIASHHPTCSSFYSTHCSPACAACCTAFCEQRAREPSRGPSQFRSRMEFAAAALEPPLHVPGGNAAARRAERQCVNTSQHMYVHSRKEDPF